MGYYNIKKTFPTYGIVNYLKKKKLYFLKPLIYII